MKPFVDDLDSAVPLQTMLGYLNFSEGRPDPRVQKQFSDAYAFLARRGDPQPWRTLAQCLQARLGTLHQGQAAAFRDIEQARTVLDLVFQRVVPAYRAHHADLLFHLEEADFFEPFFLVRVAEAVLSQRGPWTETDRIVSGALRQLNDFLGHRPIAVLESRRQGEPYDHEKVRPIPLSLKGAGVAFGPYARLVEQALAVLGATDRNLLAEACFDPEHLDELARDPRAYDFGHPVDRRTNYCFGEWDPHHIDGKGFYRRFVVRQINLDGLSSRTATGLPAEEVLFDAGAVLAGTILMASAVSGAGPTTHDSSITLSTLVPRIARVRDAFYAQLLQAQSGARARRLEQETQLTRQPFGATRQHLNQFLGRERALQIQQRRLALFLAELGYPQAARRQVAEISVASARLLTEMHLRLTTGNLLVERGLPGNAAKILPEVEDLLQRGIGCGALADPWNILGFQGQFPRFTALEDSVQDPRIDELVHVVERLLHLYGRVLGESAAQGEAIKELSRPMHRLAEWWDRFATTTVADVPHVHGGEAVGSAEHVAQALARWRQRGEAADLGFWKQHLEGFRSAKSFALVIEALLGKEDFRAASALLTTWLGQAEEAPLTEGDHSFHTLALRWMMGVCAWSGAGKEEKITPAVVDLVARFFDHLEANAEDYWQVPRINPLGIADEQAAEKTAPPEDEEESLYGAAYEGVTYKDSTDDDVEGEVLDIMPQKDFDLATEEPRLEKRLQFLSTLARLWNIATRILRHAPDRDRPRSHEHLRQWLKQARDNFRQLQELLDTLHEHEVPKPSGSFESMVEYEKRRGIKENLLQLAIATCLDQALAVGALRGLMDQEKPSSKGPAWEPLVLAMERALLRKDSAQVRALVDRFLEEFRHEPLLYTPLNQGGHPRQVLRATLAQTILRGLVANLPRQGLLRETLSILQAAREMEKNQQLVGPRVSEFDRLFQLACQAVVEAVVDSASLPGPRVGPARIGNVLEDLLEPYLALWSDHSKNLRLSMLEAITTDEEWQRLGDFIRRYGKDLFTARFMAEANLRGILHRGVGAYLDYLRDNEEPGQAPLLLIEDLDQALARADAVRFLHLILQIMVDNYVHYQDYKAIATQSDYGENLYQLLDFLQLKSSYERQAWELRPLSLVHEVLARRHPEAADLWRRQIEEHTREWAEEHLKELAELEKDYGLRLATIRDRLEERFVQPLAIDSLCALVAPALEEARRQDLADDPVVPLEERLRPFAANTTGVGFTLPPWLARLEGELHRLQLHRTALVNLAETLFQVPKVVVPFGELEDKEDEAGASS